MKTDNEIILAAIETYGARNQVIKGLEELSELQKELCKIILGARESSKRKVAEEMADVEIMLAQVKEIYELEDDVEDYKKLKLQRLKYRIDALKV